MVSSIDFNGVLKQERDMNYSVNKFLLSLNPISGDDGIDSDDDSPSVSEKKPDSKKAEFHTLNRYIFVLFMVTFLRRLHL